jgi:hypothetical protein
MRKQITIFLSLLFLSGMGFSQEQETEQQGKSEDALAVNKRFDRAWAGASHRLTSSRY